MKERSKDNSYFLLKSYILQQNGGFSEIPLRPRGSAISSSNDVYHISGAGIYLNAAPQYADRPIANNGLILSANNGIAMSVFFISNSSQVGVGVITVPDGHTVSSGDFNIIDIWRVYYYLPGALRIGSILPSPLPSTSQGIYTVTIPDSNNNMFIFNLGLYPPGFNGKLLQLLMIFFSLPAI